MTFLLFISLFSAVTIYVQRYATLLCYSELRDRLFSAKDKKIFMIVSRFTCKLAILLNGCYRQFYLQIFDLILFLNRFQ
jgi:hypothetical protein